MLDYFYSLDCDNIIYSIDSFRFIFVMNEKDVESIFKYLNDYKRADINPFSPCFKSFKYKYLFNITCLDSSYTIGLSLNGTNKQDNLKGFIDVNPNKCFKSKQCIEDIYYIYSRCFSFCIKRFDCAIDISLSRDLFILKKDNRTYQLIKNSELDKTEYLGHRNNNGFFKIYNKSIESNLKFPSLTRLELTVDYEELFNKKNYSFPFPDIFVKQDLDVIVLAPDLSSTDLVLIDLLRNLDNKLDYLKRLDYKKQKKLLPYIMNGYTLLKPNLLLFIDLLDKYKSIIKMF